MHVVMSVEPFRQKPRIISCLSALVILGVSSMKCNSILQSIQNTIVTSQYVSAVPVSVDGTQCPIIGTHDGTFHCDEALAIGMLKVLPKYSQSLVIRTRNPDLLAKCDIVVDVGAEYDPSRCRYDHHQRGFDHQLNADYKTKLSSAGLIYKHYGKEVVDEIIKGVDISESDRSKLVHIAYDKIYKDFMEHIDAIDNGISINDEPHRYIISTTLSSRVGRLNPAWNEESTNEIHNERFKDAMMLTCSEFMSHAESLAKIWWPARSIVQDAVSSRHAIHDSGKIILLSQACPWKEHLFEVEKQDNITEPILYTLYEDSGGSWRVQAVPVDSESFNSRKKLPFDWCGLRDEKLSEVANEPGSIFIHASGFIGGHKTKDGALNLAIKALTLI